MTTQEEIAWAAGLFEGEGCFYWQKGVGGGRGYLRTGMNTTDLDVLERFVEVVGVGNIRNYRTGNDASNPWGKKQSWQWAVTGKKAHLVANMLRPFLGKRRLAKLDELLAL